MTVVATLKQANAKALPEESIALRVAVLLAVEAAVLATLAQGVGGLPLRAAATVGIAGGFAFSHVARHRPGYFVKAALAAGVLLAFAHFLQAIASMSAQAINEVQIPLAELFLWVQFLHSVDVPARRDLMFSLLSSLVLIAVAAAMSVSSGLAPNIAVWAIASVVSLVLAYRSAVAAAGGFRPDPSAAAGRRRGHARPAVAVVLATAVVGTALFLVVPAAGAGKAVAFPARLPRAVQVPVVGHLANPSLGGADPSSPDGRTSSTGTAASASGYFGFTRTLDTASRGRPDDTLVMRVRATRPDFWRGQSFDRWDGRRWSQSDERLTVASGVPIELQGPIEDNIVGVDRGADFVQTVFVEQTGPNVIFAAHAPRRLYFPDNRVFQLSDGTVRTGVHLERGAVYTVVSRRVPVTEDILRSADGSGAPLPAPLVERYTQLPRVPKRVAELAASIARHEPTTYDKVRALERWIGDNTTYTLDIPPLPPGADAVEQFLFVDRKGFCEQIGSALVVMLRSLGIPARLTVGFVPGDRNPFTGMWEVRARDAHAWAEVWFDGVGWQAFDPTAVVPFAGDPYSSSAGAGLFRYLGARLPDVPGRLVRAGVLALAAVLLLSGVSWEGHRRWQRRRRERARGWADRLLERLEVEGARRGRSRRAGESAARYAEILARSVWPDGRVRAVAQLLEADAFAAAALPEEERRRAEALLAEAAADVRSRAS